MDRFLAFLNFVHQYCSPKTQRDNLPKIFDFWPFKNPNFRIILNFYSAFLNTLHNISQNSKSNICDKIAEENVSLSPDAEDGKQWMVKFNQSSRTISGGTLTPKLLIS